MTLSGEANREAPVRAEPHPTRSFALPAPGPAMSKCQRVEWSSCVNLHLILRPMGFSRG
jgi:hypothetical protein